MAKRTPFFSIVIPTRNRPELIQYCLESLLLQTFSDFEVIVSDNHTGKPCKAVFERFADERFRYVAPAPPLTMHDNWEYACNFATGEYLTVLIDKTVLRPSALQVVSAALKQMPAEMVSWWNEGYILTEEAHNYAKGRYMPTHRRRSPQYFSPREELKRRFRLDEPRGTEGVHYYWGKICFGAYHRNLTNRIKERTGRLFHPISPDYTSMLVALSYAPNALDIGQPLSISILTSISNGRMVAEHDSYAMEFIKNIDPSLRVLDTLPLKGLYASSHNVVAADYLVMKEKVGEPLSDINLNRKNLILRAREDLARRLTWDDESRKKEQYALWNKYFSELPLEERISIYWQLFKSKLSSGGHLLHGSVRMLAATLPLMRRARKAYFRAQLLQYAETRTYENILEAAGYADKYYGEPL